MFVMDAKPALLNPYLVTSVPEQSPAAQPKDSTDLMELKLTDPRMSYYAGSGHEGRFLSIEQCNFFWDLIALVTFIKDLKTVEFDVLIAGIGVTQHDVKHYQVLIPLFPDTVQWIMYEPRKINETFMQWVREKSNVEVRHKYLDEDETQQFRFSNRDRNRPLLFLNVLDTLRGYQVLTPTKFDRIAERDLETRKILTELIEADETFMRFKLPWPENGKSNQVSYLKGDRILFDLYMLPNSTELTLMIKRPKGRYKSEILDKKIFEDLMFKHNQVDRKNEHFDQKASELIWKSYRGVSYWTQNKPKLSKIRKFLCGEHSRPTRAHARSR
jgi:hypothetical protein